MYDLCHMVMQCCVLQGAHQSGVSVRQHIATGYKQTDLAGCLLNDTQPSTTPAVLDIKKAVEIAQQASMVTSQALCDEGTAASVAQHTAQPLPGAACIEQSQHEQLDSAVVAAPEAEGLYRLDDMGIDNFAY